MDDPDKQSRNALNRGAGAYSTEGVDTRPPAEAFVPFSSRPLVIFNLQNVDPPAALYVSQEDILALHVTTSDPAFTLATLVYRMLRAADGKVIVGTAQLKAAALRTETGVTINLTEGYLLSVLVTGNVGSKRGQTFITVQLVHSSTLNPFNQQLISGYLMVDQLPSWPGAEFVNSTEGPGWKESLQVSNPAAGADWSQTVPTGARWRVESIVATLTTLVAVANRIPTFIVDDGVNVVFQVDVIAAEVASSAKVYCLTAGQTPATGAGSTISLPLPGPLVMNGGWRIRTSTSGLQGTDQWSGISLNVEEWIQP